MRNLVFAAVLLMAGSAYADSDDNNGWTTGWYIHWQPTSNCVPMQAVTHYSNPDQYVTAHAANVVSVDALQSQYGPVTMVTFRFDDSEVMVPFYSNMKQCMLLSARLERDGFLPSQGGH